MITDGIEVDRHCSALRAARTLYDGGVSPFPHFTFNQVFLTIDRLSWEGKVRLRHPNRFTYLVSAVSSGTRAQASLSADR